MFKITAAGAAVLVTAAVPAMAQSLTLGQYKGIIQYVSVDDTSGVCSQIGVTPGAVSNAVGTVGGLGNAWTQVIASTGNNGSLNPYGVVPAACTLAALPAASAFTAGAGGSYNASPTDTETTTCAKGASSYTLTSSNGGSTPNGAQTLTVTLIGNPTGSADSGFEINTTNTTLAVGGSPYCYVNTSALYLLSAVNLTAK